MGDAVNRIGAPESMWDLARIQRNPTTQDNAIAAFAALSPTALLPAVWALSQNGPQQLAVWRIMFSTDTEIRWMLYSSPDPQTLTPSGYTLLGNAVGLGQHTPQAEVIALPGNVFPITGGVAAAASYFDILAGGWLLTAGRTSLLLSTIATAAYVTATFWYAEYVL